MLLREIWITFELVPIVILNGIDVGWWTYRKVKLFAIAVTIHRPSLAKGVVDLPFMDLVGLLPSGVGCAAGFLILSFNK